MLAIWKENWKYWNCSRGQAAFVERTNPFLWSSLTWNFNMVFCFRVWIYTEKSISTFVYLPIIHSCKSHQMLNPICFPLEKKITFTATIKYSKWNMQCNILIQPEHRVKFTTFWEQMRTQHERFHLINICICLELISSVALKLEIWCLIAVNTLLSNRMPMTPDSKAYRLLFCNLLYNKCFTYFC